MKTTIVTRVALALLLFCGAFYACTKDASQGSTSSTDPTSAASLQTAADDQSQLSYESDALNNDVNTAMSGDATVTGASAGTSLNSGEGNTLSDGETVSDGIRINKNLICDATITYSDSNGVRTITIVYDGSTCNGRRTRTGTVVITLPSGKGWKDAGATATVSIQDLKITRVRDGKSWTINGMKTYTNVSGGLLVDLPLRDSIVHSIAGNMNVTFDNGKQRTWNISKQRVFKYDNGITLTTTGTHTDSLGNTNVAEWGVNRFGVSFESEISQPKIIRQDCEYRLTAGQNTVLRSDGITSVITYGLDSEGNPTGCPGNGTYYFKLVVTKPNGKVYTYILPY